MNLIILKTIYCKKNEKSKPARALGYITHAVGMNRVFSKDDLLELLIRFQLMYPDSNLSLNYFNSSYLFTYSVDNVTEYYTLNDLIDNLGLEVSESVYNLSREGFLNHIHARRGDAILSGILSYGCVLKPLPVEFRFYVKDPSDKQLNNLLGVEEDDPVKVINKKLEANLVGIINDARIADATKVAEIIIGEIEEEEFKKLEKRVAIRKAEIEYELANKPTVRFNLDDVPIEVKRKIYKHVEERFGFPETDGYIDEQVVEWGDDLMYLIWLWANGFIEEGIISCVSDHFDLDYNKPVYQDDEGTGPSLNFVREYLEIDLFFPDFKNK